MTTAVRLTYLADLYQLCIGGDHHKDRDCHWQVQERWEYGEYKGWFVYHCGYCYKEVEEYCKTYEDVLERLEFHLVAAINEQVYKFMQMRDNPNEWGRVDVDYANERLQMLEERGYFET